MQTFINVELAQVNRQVVVVVDGGVELAEVLVDQVAALDAKRELIWRIEAGVAHSADKILFCSNSPRSVIADLRVYVSSVKALRTADDDLASPRACARRRLLAKAVR